MDLLTMGHRPERNKTMKQVMTMIALSSVLILSGCGHKSEANHKQDAEASIAVARINAEKEIEIARIKYECEGGK